MLQNDYDSLSVLESAPICLPAGDAFPDKPETNYEDKVGVIVGEGHTWDHHKSCITTMGGPNPFQNCKFPFYGLKSHTGEYQPIYGCVTRFVIKHLTHLCTGTYLCIILVPKLRLVNLRFAKAFMKW